MNTEVVLGANDHMVDVNFGWDYDYLPKPLLSYSSSCIVSVNAFMRRGPGKDFLAIATSPEGDLFEVLAKSEIEEPLWLFGKIGKNKYGWMSEAVLDCEELDPAKLLIAETPLRIITPTPVLEPSKPITCSSNLDQQQCIKAGEAGRRAASALLLNPNTSI